jgi:hypothetical protein
MKIYLVLFLTVFTVTATGEFSFAMVRGVMVQYFINKYVFLKAASSLARFPLSVFLDTELIRTKRDGRIIGGADAKEGEFPWMVR